LATGDRMRRENWDDLRFVLAVADEGSVSGAARRLGVNHATVLRRIAAFEEGIGTELFDKTARGYLVPTDRARIVDAAREVDRAVQAVARLAEGARAPLAGEIRITSTDSFCQVLLPDILDRIAGDTPGLRITLLSTNSHLDLGRTHADITVRPTVALPDDLIGQRAGRFAFAVYAAPGVGPDAPWLGLTGPLARTVPGKWQAETIDAGRITDAADSFLTLREMAARGRGLAILPAYLGRGDRRLRPVAAEMPPLAVDVWVASHADLADVPRIALMRRRLTEAFQARAGGMASSV